MKFWTNLRKRFSRKTILGIVIGGLGGFAYYYFIGCSSGTCPITANPWSSIFYGSLIGLVWTIK
ncbi:hypothetical protein DMA11_11485 [Marinilabiliaceae bacterium JC017]|nr:hypothetical protein DMA11_11485 [Marinilabiliaceae bacterium JC017]